MAMNIVQVIRKNCSVPFDNEDVDAYLNSVPLISTPVHVIVGILGYILLIKMVLPKYMEHRKPYDLKTVTKAYNFFQILINATICYLYFAKVKQTPPLYLWENCCEHVTYGSNCDSSNYIQIVNLELIYYTLKFIDLIETCFFVLRKKFSQVSFLHVYHHVIVIAAMWINIYLCRVESSATLLTLNSFVHFIMYIYYFLSSFGPRVQKYLWWKRYLTIVQMVQLLIGLSILIRLSQLGCVTLLFSTVWSFTVITILLLFINFYLKSYKKKSE